MIELYKIITGKYGMTKYRVDRILPARRPWHNDYDVLITAPNDRVDRILAAGEWRLIVLQLA